MTAVLRSRIDAPDARERARHDYSRRGGRNMTDGEARAACGMPTRPASGRPSPVTLPPRSRIRSSSS
ncbi:hypothetical protein CO709_04070 [Burkholderia thailandensis]|nr:hypothetical protein CO709_04070 [Burkholderia thailandensis]